MRDASPKSQGEARPTETVRTRGWNDGALDLGCGCPWSELGRGLSTARHTFHDEGCEFSADPLVENRKGGSVRAEVERLRRALAPFAQLADEVGDDVPGDFVLVSYYGTEQRPPTVLHVADLKAARAALGGAA